MRVRCSVTVGLTNVVAALALVSIALIIPVAATAAQVAHVQKLAKIQPCVGKPVIKPSIYVITCADANTELVNLNWKTWTSTGAEGSGRYTYNTCTPTCVAGHFVHFAANVVLSHPKVEKTGSIFSKMVITYRPTKGGLVTSGLSLPLKAY